MIPRMTWNEGIDGPHLEIAASVADRIGILAGPGTGKTSYGLMRRVVRLLSEGVPGERILLLSFTRVAAADLRDKVAALSVPGVEDIVARTLHGYCFGMLQKEAVLQLTGRVPRILLKHEADLMLRDLGASFGDIRTRRESLEAYVAGWARGESDYPGSPTVAADTYFEIAVMRWLRAHKAMLIGEVVPLAYKYLRDNPTASERSAFDHIIVDEYQDLNLLEQQLLELLAEDHSLCVAGDDDQSIYSMRYANPSGILNFIEDEETESHTISVCGRCPETILKMANSLISNTPNRNKPEITCRDSSLPGVVSIIQWDGLDAEVEGLSAAIASDIQQNRRSPGDILVLTNWRQIGERIRQRLGELGVSCQSFFSEEELETDSAREAIALLRLVANSSDLVAYRVLMGLGDAQGRTAAYSKLTEVANQQGIGVIDLLNRLLEGETFSGLSVPALVSRFRTARARVDQLKDLSVEQLIIELFPEQNSEITDLRSIVLTAGIEVDNPQDLLRKVIEMITQDEVPQTPDFVRIMSLHKSKGLTSPAVFVAGAVAGVLPTIPANATEIATPAMVEEGRRLFYVALTRSSNQLVISCSRSVLVSDALARGIKIDRDSITYPGGKPTARTIACPYISELGPSAPRPITGTAWLRSY